MQNIRNGSIPFERWHKQYQGLGGKTNVNPFRMAVFLAEDVAHTITREQALIFADPLFKGVARLCGRPYFGFWSKGEFTNPVNDKYPMGGYRIDHPYWVDKRAHQFAFAVEQADQVRHPYVSMPQLLAEAARAERRHPKEPDDWFQRVRAGVPAEHILIRLE